MDGFGSRWTPGGFSEAMRPTADRPSVVPNDGGPRAWAVTGHGRARPATPPVSRRARGPDNARRDAPRRTTCRRTSTRPRRCEARWVPRRGMSGHRVRGVIAQGGSHIERHGNGRATKALGLKWRRATSWHREELGHAARLDVRKNVRGPGCVDSEMSFGANTASPSGSKLGFGAVPKVPLAAKRISVQWPQGKECPLLEMKLNSVVKTTESIAEASSCGLKPFESETRGTHRTF